MAGNSTLFKQANALMRKGYTRKEAFFKAAQDMRFAEHERTAPLRRELAELNKPRAARKTVKKNPVRPLRSRTPKTLMEMNKTELRKYIDGMHKAREYGAEFEKATRIYNDKYRTGRNPIAVKRKTRATTMAAAKSYVRRPSQSTHKTPSKRLANRRAENLRVPVGVFPNPSRYKKSIDARRGTVSKSRASTGLYKVELIYPTGNTKLMAQFYGAPAAKEYAKALAQKYDTYGVRVYT